MGHDDRVILTPVDALPFRERARPSWGRRWTGAALTAQGITAAPPPIGVSLVVLDTSNDFGDNGEHLDFDGAWVLDYDIADHGPANNTSDPLVLRVWETIGEVQQCTQLPMRAARHRIALHGRRVRVEVFAPGNGGAGVLNAAAVYNFAVSCVPSAAIDRPLALITNYKVNANPDLATLCTPIMATSGPNRWSCKRVVGGGILADATSAEHPGWLALFDSNLGPNPGDEPIVSLRLSDLAKGCDVDLDVWTSLYCAISEDPQTWVVPAAGYTGTAKVQFYGWQDAKVGST